MEIQFTGGDLPDDVCPRQSEEFYQQMKKVVVYIRSYLPEPEVLEDVEDLEYTLGKEQTQTYETREGTGFVVHKDGLVLTALHVVKDCEAFTLSRFNDEEEKWRAELIADDPGKDLALLQILDSNWECPTEEYNYVKFEDEDTIKVGQRVFLIGHSHLIPYSFLMGDVMYPCDLTINCRLVRDIYGEDVKRQHEDLLTEEELPLIQINNTHVGGGGSGSPIFNSNGRVIALLSFTLKNFNFAVHLGGLKEFINSKMPEALEKGEREREAKRERRGGMVPPCQN